MAGSKETELPAEKLFLVYVNTDNSEDEYVEQELEGLCEAAGGKVVGSIRQRLPKPHRASFIGPGKLEELKAYAAESKADMVVIDAELSGSQLRTLEEVLENRVLDRTQLILDIFARRAKTREGSAPSRVGAAHLHASAPHEPVDQIRAPARRYRNAGALVRLS